MFIFDWFYGVLGYLGTWLRRLVKKLLIDDACGRELRGSRANE